VHWRGPYNETTGFPMQKNLIYMVLGLNPDTPANQVLFDPDYDASIREITITFQGILSLPPPSFVVFSCFLPFFNFPPRILLILVSSYVALSDVVGHLLSLPCFSSPRLRLFTSCLSHAFDDV